MTKKERVVAVINGKIPDAVPYFIDLTISGKEKVAQYYKIDFDLVQKTIVNHLLFLKFTAPEGFIPEKVGENLFKDEFGVTWDPVKTKDIGDWGFVDHPVKDMEIGDYKFPDGSKKGRFYEAEKVAAQNPGCFNLLQMTGIFDTAWHPTGIQDMLMGMALDSDFTGKMMDMALEYNLGILEQLPDYIHGVRFIEDWGDQKCLMMGLKNWRRYLKPRLKEMYQACKKKGCAVFIHSCGNITELLPEIIELGVDVVDPVQPEVMDINLIKKEYGKDIVLFGGMGCQSTIPLGTPEQVLNEARERVALLSEGGKCIFGPSGAIPTEAPIENVIALIEFCKEMSGKK
jgi:uroporphyrinogen decarboxylase